MNLHLVGTARVLASWRAATDAEVAAIDWGGDDSIAVARLDDRSIVLGWIGTVCDVEATLTVEAAGLVVAPAPRKGCDLVPVPRGLELTYRSPVDPGSIALRLGEPALLPE